mgnify:CR=1 FL=1
MEKDDLIDIEKAYSDDELDRLFLQVQLREITLCETCDVFFKYVPQKRFCDACIIERDKASSKAASKRLYDKVAACPKLWAEKVKRMREYDQRPERKAKKREYNQRPDVKKRKARQQRERYWKRKAKKNED